MCIKTIYFNTYIDGDRDITERVDACMPGRLCANPRIREFERTIMTTKAHLSGEVAANANISSPRSLSPGSDADPMHPSRRSVYVNGVKIVDVRRSRDRNERSPRRERSTRVPRAPEPPAPRPLRTAMPVPFQRSTTMPHHRHDNAFGLDTAATEPRGRRPLIVEERVGGPSTSTRRSAAVPIEIVNHSSDPLRRRHSKRDDTGGLLSPRMHYTRDMSPVGYSSAAEDAREKQERRRRRRELRDRAAATPSSAPGPAPVGLTGYASSWESSSGASSFTNSPSSPARTTGVGPSPAVAAVKKELRWEDEQRAAQNDRIRNRRKMPKEALHGEVKSILKNSPSSGPSPTRGPLTDEEELEQLRRSVAAMEMRSSPSGSRETSADRRARREQEAADAERERLRNRFSMPPRRFTTGFGGGPGTKRRSEVWYDDGRYKYM